MVIIGVAGEGVEIGLKIFKRKCKRLRQWYGKHEYGIDIIGGIFWVFVVAGLAIEFKGNNKAREIGARENAKLSGDAGRALKDAALANERAAKFDADRVLIEKQAEEIRSTNFVLQAKASGLEKEASEAKLRLAEIEARTQPRHISRDQKEKLVAALKDAPKGKVMLCTINATDETKAYEWELMQLLEALHFQLDSSMIGTPYYVRPYNGIELAVKDRKNPPPHALPILRAFITAGIDCIPAQKPTLRSNDELEIGIGNLGGK